MSPTMALASPQGHLQGSTCNWHGCPNLGSEVLPSHLGLYSARDPQIQHEIVPLTHLQAMEQARDAHEGWVKAEEVRRARELQAEFRRQREAHAATFYFDASITQKGVRNQQHMPAGQHKQGIDAVLPIPGTPQASGYPQSDSILPSKSLNHGKCGHRSMPKPYNWAHVEHEVDDEMPELVAPRPFSSSASSFVQLTPSKDSNQQTARSDSLKWGSTNKNSGGWGQVYRPGEKQVFTKTQKEYSPPTKSSKTKLQANVSDAWGLSDTAPSNSLFFEDRDQSDHGQIITPSADRFNLKSERGVDQDQASKGKHGMTERGSGGLDWGCESFIKPDDYRGLDASRYGHTNRKQCFNGSSVCMAEKGDPWASEKPRHAVRGVLSPPASVAPSRNRSKSSEERWARAGWENSIFADTIKETNHGFGDVRSETKTFNYFGDEASDYCSSCGGHWSHCIEGCINVNERPGGSWGNGGSMAATSVYAPSEWGCPKKSKPNSIYSKHCSEMPGPWDSSKINKADPEITRLRQQVDNLEESIYHLRGQAQCAKSSTTSSEVEFLRGLIMSGANDRDTMHRMEVKMAEMAISCQSGTPLQRAYGGW